jgi:hypothetical protein
MLTRPLLEEEIEESDVDEEVHTPTQKRPRVPSSAGAIQVTLSSSRDQLDNESSVGIAANNQRDYIWQQRRVIFDVWVPLLIFVLICITIAVCGISLAFFPSIVPIYINDWLLTLLNPTGLIYLGYGLFAASILIPVSFLSISMWSAVPGVRQRQRSELLSDTTLNEIALSSKAALKQHVTVFSPMNQRPVGIIILLPGTGCPRETTFVLARELSSSVNGGPLRAISVDLPGHGTLSSVKYSYARCERLLKYLISIEIEEFKKLGRNVVSLTAPSGTGIMSNSCKMASLSSVILYAYGGSFNFAMQFAQSHRYLVSGLAVCGRVESFGDRSLRMFVLESLLRLRSACAVAAVSVKGRVIASHGAESDKSIILSKTFELSVLPDMIREARLLRTSGGSGGGNNNNNGKSVSLMSKESLGILNRDVLFFGTEKMLSKLKARLGERNSSVGGNEMANEDKHTIDVSVDELSREREKGQGLMKSVSSSSLSSSPSSSSSSSSSLFFIVARGVRDELVASLDKTKNAFLAQELSRFALTSFTSYGIEMELKRRNEEEKIKASTAAAEAIVSSIKKGSGRAFSGGSSQHYSGSSRHSSSLPSRMSSPTSDQLRSSLSGTSTTPTLSSSFTRDVSGILVRGGSVSRDREDNYGSFGENSISRTRKSSAGVRFAGDS